MGGTTSRAPGRVEGATGWARCSRSSSSPQVSAVDVPPKLSSRAVRLLERGKIDKTDLNDARPAAIVAWRTPALNVVAGLDEHRVVLRLASVDDYLDHHIARAPCAAHADVCSSKAAPHDR
ncbi:MAG: hypothetical protein U0Q03_08390 [Acidimicrobiales bacterium]